jgi:hypothetical protein
LVDIVQLGGDKRACGVFTTGMKRIADAKNISTTLRVRTGRRRTRATGQATIKVLNGADA